jgi:cyclase
MRKALFLAAALLCGTVHAQTDWSKVEVKTEKLNDSLYMLTGAGGNLGLVVGKDATFLVDDQYEQMAPKIKAAVEAISKKPIRFVINTHWHFDHTGGNEFMGNNDAVIVAHDNVRKRMSTKQAIEFLGLKFEASPEKALPSLTFQDNVTFHLNGETIRVVHMPNGHTDGDAIVHFQKSNVIHMGDLYFNGYYPFIDTYSGGNVDGVIAAADKVLAMSDDATRLIPGHGPLARKADLKAYRDMLAAISQRIKAQMKDGKKMEDIIASKPTADFDAKWGKGFIPPARFVEMLYKNLLK